METEYGQNRKYFHNVRFSPEEEKIIRDAVLDKRLAQRQVVEIEPYKIDNSCLIPQVIDAIRTYDFRLVRAITALRRSAPYPTRRPGADS